MRVHEGNRLDVEEVTRFQDGGAGWVTTQHCFDGDAPVHEYTPEEISAMQQESLRMRETGSAIPRSGDEVGSAAGSELKRSAQDFRRRTRFGGFV